MERMVSFYGYEDKLEGGFESLDKTVNGWLEANQSAEVINRQVCLAQRSNGLVMMVVSIFYDAPSKERMFNPIGVVKS